MGRPDRVTVVEAVKGAAEFLLERGVPSPRLDAEVLLAHVLECTRVQLYVRYDQPLAEEERARMRDLLRRRARREPVAYITGAKEFRSRDFHVDANVLCPRPETEHLVDEVLELAKGTDEARILEPRILELGAGSGCVCVTLALELPEATVAASEISTGALEVAAANAQRLGATVDLRAGDLFEPFRDDEPFDLVVSNPPYLSAAELEAAAPELRHEPRGALVSEPESDSVAARILREAPAHLRPGGSLLLEMGSTQGARLTELATTAGFTGVRVVKDLAGLDRVLIGRR